ncbi:hypothetical protein ABPG74_012091 [Tetrahymena malaccensis]
MNQSQPISNKDKFSQSQFLKNDQQSQNQFEKNYLSKDGLNEDDQPAYIYEEQKDDPEIDLQDQQQNKQKAQRKKLKYNQPFPVEELGKEALLTYKTEKDDCDEEDEHDIEQNYSNEHIQEGQELQDISEKKQMDNILNFENEDIKNQTNQTQQIDDFLNKYLKDENQQDLQNIFEFCNQIQDDIDQSIDQIQQQVMQDEFIQDENQEQFRTLTHSNFNLQPISTFSMSDYMRTTINDHYFHGENQNVKERLNETINQVHNYVVSKIDEKKNQIEEFKKILSKFIFDYRYDQYQQPRKYFHSLMGEINLKNKDQKTDQQKDQQQNKYYKQKITEQSLKNKFQDPKFDERMINFDIQDFNETPFSLFANEIDVYINCLSNLLCIKQAFYSELELYLNAVYQDKCNIESNYLYERRIYHQCIKLTFKDTNLTFKLRIQLKNANLFRARDKIFQSFYSLNKPELNIFSSFVFYWAQKRQLLSEYVMDKNAWIILIIYFFQINKRLPPSINYDQLTVQAKKLENKCYQKAIEKLYKIKENSKGSIKTTIDNVFDFQTFEKEGKSKFVIQYNLDKNFNNKQNNQTNKDEEYYNNEINDRAPIPENMKVFQVLPIIRPSTQELHAIKDAPNFNYGYFFFKFLFFLNFQIVIDPISVSINGQIQRKKVNDRNENAEPISIRDTMRPEINLVSHLSYEKCAFTHLVDQIKFAYFTIYENKSEKLFLQNLQNPVFSTNR